MGRGSLWMLLVMVLGGHAPSIAATREQASLAGLSCEILPRQRSSFVGDEVVLTVRTDENAWLETLSFPSNSGISGYFALPKEVRLSFANRGAFTLTAVVRDAKGTTGLCRVTHSVY